jgi:quinolinate synthase
MPPQTLSAPATSTGRSASDPSALADRVRRLARERNAVILAHNYQVREVKRVADALGDSYGLAVEAQKAESDWIVFCGVRFMAETAKLLNPSQRVVLPEAMAGCDLAESITADDLRLLKRKHPEAQTVMYINSNIDIKAESDAICTSSNALKVVNAMESDTVIFGPDKNLAAHVARQTPKKIISWNGCCPIHEEMAAELLDEAIARDPTAYVLVHPECPREVQERADEVLSTSQMLKRAGQVNAERFLVGTEIGLIEQLQDLYPDRQFTPLQQRVHSCDGTCGCPYMKMTKLTSVARALETGEVEITIPEAYRAPAMKAVERMLHIGT